MLPVWSAVLAFTSTDSHGPEQSRAWERKPFLQWPGTDSPVPGGRASRAVHPPFPGAHGAGGGPIRRMECLARPCRVARRAVRRAPAVKRPWNSRRSRCRIQFLDKEAGFLAFLTSFRFRPLQWEDLPDGLLEADRLCNSLCTFPTPFQRSPSPALPPTCGASHLLKSAR